MVGVYDGLTVIELADRRNQWAGKLLCDGGARVIQIEPVEGSPGRWCGPFVDDDPRRPDLPLKLLVWQAISPFPADDARKPNDGVQGRAQFMTHVRQEGALRLICLLGHLTGALQFGHIVIDGDKANVTSVDVHRQAGHIDIYQ